MLLSNTLCENEYSKDFFPFRPTSRWLRCKGHIIAHAGTSVGSERMDSSADACWGFDANDEFVGFPDPYFGRFVACDRPPLQSAVLLPPKFAGAICVDYNCSQIYRITIQDHSSRCMQGTICATAFLGHYVRIYEGWASTAGLRDPAAAAVTRAIRAVLTESGVPAVSLEVGYSVLTPLNIVTFEGRHMSVVASQRQMASVG